MVDTIKEEAAAGRLKDCELFIFTDNSTAEGCFYRGTSKSRYLHALILELRKVEMKWYDHSRCSHLWTEDDRSRN